MQRHRGLRHTTLPPGSDRHRCLGHTGLSLTLNQELFPEIGRRASVPESLLVFCSSTSWSNRGDHASLSLLVSVRDVIGEVPGDCVQEISAPFLGAARLFTFFCRRLLCTVYIGAL